jgi:glyoxylase-like metal-dependent hydrolase (beta-lactamase superfamily II)
VQEVAPGIALVDTLLGGMPGVTATYLVRGERPALIDAGARTSAAAVRAALADMGLGPADLRWIVLTHVHLDHCGATGILAAAFPRATVVVHRRGARHLVDPARLVAASAAVYGANWSLYGGLDATPAERIAAVEDGHQVDLGGGRRLTLVETLGHARHHMSVHDESTGTVLAGDALGVRFPGAGLYPALPPPDIDLEAGDASLVRLAGLAPERVCVSHFGPVGDPRATIDGARRQLALMREATIAAGPDPAAIAPAIERRLPLAATVSDPAAVALLRRLGWAEANALGLAGWAARQDRPAGQ